MAGPRDSAGPRQRTETQSPAGTLTGWRAANVLRACQSSGATAAHRAAERLLAGKLFGRMTDALATASDEGRDKPR